MEDPELFSFKYVWFAGSEVDMRNLTSSPITIDIIGLWTGHPGCWYLMAIALILRATGWQLLAMQQEEKKKSIWVRAGMIQKGQEKNLSSKPRVSALPAFAWFIPFLFIPPFIPIFTKIHIKLYFTPLSTFFCTQCDKSYHAGQIIKYCFLVLFFHLVVIPHGSPSLHCY